jgi:O-succinylbenzoic acid--CoA ligase
MGADLKLLLRQRWGKDWLIGLDSQRFWQELDEMIQTLLDEPLGSSLLLISEADPLRFLIHFFAACSLGHSVVLGNPGWGKREWEQVGIVDLPWGSGSWQTIPWDGNGLRSLILIPSGGSSGKLKFVTHTWQTLMASVRGFQAHFELSQVNAYCVLPLFHVSGLMQVLRVLVSGGKLALQPYQVLKQGHILPLPESGFLSLVPTQLQWLLQQDNGYVDWLKTFRAVLLGGAPAWPSLVQQAREVEVPLALTYGMTETASQVATLLPEEFLAGATSNGRALPHTQIFVMDERGQPLGKEQIGQVVIEAESLALGYVLPGNDWQMFALKESQVEWWAVSTLREEYRGADEFLRGLFFTDDIGFLDAGGALHIIGRRSSKMITGGENVFPEEVEALLLASESVQDACVVGLPDQQWGQRLCAVVVLAEKTVELKALGTLMAGSLAAYKCPKVWIVGQAIPRTPQGKVNRKQALELAQTVLGIYEHRSLP